MTITNKQTYNITFSINREHLLFMCVTLYSLLKNNQQYNFNIYVLHNNCLNNEEINNITNKHPLNQYNNFKIYLVDVSLIEELKYLKPVRIYKKYDDFWEPEIYFKLFINKLLPNLDTILHLDTDVIIKKDIRELLDINIDSYTFAGDNEYNKGINVGVMLINLKNFKKNNILEKSIKIIKAESLNEQKTINYFQNQVLFLPANLIYTAHQYDSKTKGRKTIDNISINSCFIIHYTKCKPWFISRKTIPYRNVNIDLYYYYLKDFINDKYRFRFYLLKIYAKTLAYSVNSINRRINKIFKKNTKYNMDFILNKLYKYSTIGKK